MVGYAVHRYDLTVLLDYRKAGVLTEADAILFSKLTFPSSRMAINWLDKFAANNHRMGYGKAIEDAVQPAGE